MCFYFKIVAYFNLFLLNAIVLLLFIKITNFLAVFLIKFLFA